MTHKEFIEKYNIKNFKVINNILFIEGDVDFSK